MAKCIMCGQKRLFLHTNRDGLCRCCESLHLKDVNGDYINKVAYSTCFDYEAFSEVDYNRYIINGDHNRSIVCNDVDDIIRRVNDLRREYPEIPRITKNSSSIEFDFVESDTPQYVAASFPPLTPKGSVPLKRLEIVFHISEYVFGTIRYSASGIHDAEIITWRKTCVESSERLKYGGIRWRIAFHKIDGILTMSKIDKNTGGISTPIYRIADENRIIISTESRE